jgi:hypothetical protein
MIRKFEKAHPEIPPVYITACSGTGEQKVMEEVQLQGFNSFLVLFLCLMVLKLSCRYANCFHPFFFACLVEACSTERS